MDMRDALNTVFLNDSQVVDLYDPTIKVETTEDVVSSIEEKLKEYHELFDCQMVIRDWGYVFWTGNLLVSFGINPLVRDQEHKMKLWELIKESIDGDFYCLLWTKNERAIKWLVKMGMSSEKISNEITMLKLCR